MTIATAIRTGSMGEHSNEAPATPTGIASGGGMQVMVVLLFRSLAQHLLGKSVLSDRSNPFLDRHLTCVRRGAIRQLG